MCGKVGERQQATGQQGSGHLAGDTGARRTQTQLSQSASQPKLQAKQTAPKVQGELRRTQERNRRGKTLHFLEPEARDREETTFLTQRKLKGEEGNQRKSRGWLKPKDRFLKCCLSGGRAGSHSREGRREDNVYCGRWTELVGEEENGVKVPKQRGQARRRATWNQAKGKDQI